MSASGPKPCGGNNNFCMFALYREHAQNQTETNIETFETESVSVFLLRNVKSIHYFVMKARIRKPKAEEHSLRIYNDNFNFVVLLLRQKQKQKIRLGLN